MTWDFYFLDDAFGRFLDFDIIININVTFKY